MSSTAKRYGILAIVGLSTPAALVVETGLRSLIMPPQFNEVRAWLSPSVTPWAWAMVPLAALATALGFALQRWLTRRALRAPRRAGVSEQQVRQRAEFEALILSTSAPQVPALIATMTFMVGADFLPVALAMAVATLGVLSLGLAVRPTPTPPHRPAPPPGVRAPPPQGS